MLDARLCRLSVLIILAGCATQPSKVANIGPDIQCHSAELVGSVIPKSVCTTKDQRDLKEQLSMVYGEPIL